MRATSALLVALLAALTACSSDSATRDRQTMLSWTAAARMKPWDKLDLSDPDRPRLTWSRRELRRAA